MTTTWSPNTILVLALTLIFAISGAVIAAWHPATLSFTTYSELLAAFVGANGLTVIGHGIAATPPTPTPIVALAPSAAATIAGQPVTGA